MKKVKAFLLSLGVAGVMSAAILAVAGGNCEIRQFAPRARPDGSSDSHRLYRRLFRRVIRGTVFRGEGSLAGRRLWAVGSLCCSGGFPGGVSGSVYHQRRGAACGDFSQRVHRRYLGRKPQAKGEILTEGNHTFCRVAYLCALDFV